MTTNLLRDCVNAMLPHLEGWAVEFTYDHSATVTRAADGLAIGLWVGHGAKRVEVSPRPPLFEGAYRSLRDWGVIPYGAKGPAATFAIDRDPKAAARVVAKIAAEYAPLYAAVREKMAAETGQRDSTLALADEIAAILGKPLRERDRERGRNVSMYLPDGFKPGDCYGTVEVNSYGKVDVKLSSLPAETAKALLNFLKTLA